MNWRKALAMGPAGASMLGAPMKSHAQDVPPALASALATDKELSSAEQKFVDLWKTLSPHQQDELRPKQQEWMKYVNTLPPAQRIAEINRHIKELWPTEQTTGEQASPAPRAQAATQPSDVGQTTELEAVEQDLNDLWQTLSPQKRAALLPAQRQWLKYKDSLPPVERLAELKRHIRELWPNIDVPPGGLETRRGDVYSLARGEQPEPTSTAELQIRKRWQQRTAAQRQQSFQQELEKYGVTQEDIQKFNATPVQDRRVVHIRPGIDINLVGGTILGPATNSKTGNIVSVSGWLLKDNRGTGIRSIVVVGGHGAPLVLAKINSDDFELDEQ